MRLHRVWLKALLFKMLNRHLRPHFNKAATLTHKGLKMRNQRKQRSNKMLSLKRVPFNLLVSYSAMRKLNLMFF